MPRPIIALALQQRHQEAFRVSDLELERIKLVVGIIAADSLKAFNRSDYYKAHVMAALAKDYEAMEEEGRIISKGLVVLDASAPATEPVNEIAAQTRSNEAKVKAAAAKPKKAPQRARKPVGKSKTKRKAA